MEMGRIFTPLIISLSIVLLVSISPLTVSAQSYVLPYPGVMPGSRWYQIDQLFTRIKGFYAFGNLAQARYQRSLSDERMVTARTLVWYGQYALAAEYLHDSSEPLMKLPGLLEHAEKKGVDVSEEIEKVRSMCRAHTDVIQEIESKVPETITWSAEKRDEIIIDWKQLLSQARMVRENLCAMR